jgi:signal transduction histidine kinase
MSNEFATPALARLLAASSETMVLRLSRDGHLLSASDAVHRLVGQAALGGLDYIFNLSPDERAALLYTRDLWRGTASLLLGDRPPIGIRLTAVPDGEALLLLMEAGIEPLLTLQDEMGAINSQLTNLTRERAKQAAKLKRAHDDLQEQHHELQALTEQLEAQNEELVVLNEELEAQNEEIQRSYAANTELSEANAELHRLDTMKNEFIGIISHELKTPLNFIMGYGSVLEDGVLGELNTRQIDAISRVMEGADRLDGLIQELLDTSKVQAGKLMVRLEPVDYAALLTRLLTDIRPALSAKSLTLETSGLAPPAVQADPRRLHQVLRNLLSNAIKFTPEGGTITVETQDLADGHVLTTIRDTGIGIPADSLSRIFEAFYQVDSSATRAYGGTGLGLSIVRSLVDAMNGKIKVESAPGQGSAFHVVLPKAPVPQAAERHLEIQQN